MNYNYRTVDLPPDPQGEVAVLLDEFRPGEEWHVLSCPISLEDNNMKVMVHHKPGPLCVKLFPYITTPRPEGVMGYAIQLGAHLASLMVRDSDVELLLVIGVPVYQKHDANGNERLQIYLGAAIRRK